MSAEPSLSAVLSAEGLRIESTGDLLEFQSGRAEVETSPSFEVDNAGRPSIVGRVQR